MPSEFPLSIWIRAKAIYAGKSPIIVKITLPGVEAKQETLGEVEVKNTAIPFSIFTAGFPSGVHLTVSTRVELDVNCKVLDAGGPSVRLPRKTNV